MSGKSKKPATVTIADIARAVVHSDSAKIVASKKSIAELERVLQIAMLKVGLCALCDKGVVVNLGNGNLLHCTVTEAAK